MGLEKFSLAFSAVQKEFSQRRAARKRHRAVQVRPTRRLRSQQSPHVLRFFFFPFVFQAVAHPDVAAKKKLKKHKNKIEAKKRKIEFLRPGYKAKRQRGNTLKDLAMVQ